MYTDNSIRFMNVRMQDSGSCCAHNLNYESNAFFVLPAAGIMQRNTDADIFSGRFLPEKSDAGDYHIVISANEERRIVSSILYNLNMNSANPEFYFLREVIIEVANSNLFIPELTKESMLKVGKAFKTSARTVENALNRVLVDINEKNSRQQIIKTIIGKELSVDSSFMNTKEFVAMVADHIRLTYSETTPVMIYEY